MQNREVRKVSIQSNTEAQLLFGESDSFLKLIEKNFDVSVVLRGEGLAVIGANFDQVHEAANICETLLHRIRSGQQINDQDIKIAIKTAQTDPPTRSGQIITEAIPVFSKRGVVRPKTPNQQKYVSAIRTDDLVFGIGPAGTGKTYLAMAMAVSALKSGKVSRIILTRPAVEAGEKLGFLPGDLTAKIDPYLRPLFDALYDMMPIETLERYIDQNTIEVAPLAFMRGRTLNNAFVVLDEAQNATIAQMKMFLTRLGYSSKAVVTGDITQTDLPRGQISGLTDVQNVLKEIEGISFIYFTKADVVRHELVQRIIEAYERDQSE